MKCNQGRPQNVEKALFKEITVNKFLELECMKPKIQATETPKPKYSKGSLRVCFNKEENNCKRKV